MSGRAALYALATGQFVVAVTSLSVIGMVAEMKAALNVSTAAIAQLLTVFAVVYAVTAPVLQAALGHLPRRAVISAAMVLSALSCFWLAMAQDWWTVAAARVSMALAAAVIGPSAAAAAASLVSPERRAAALSIVFGGITISSVLGIPASSFLAQNLGWREAWVAVGCAALLCAPAVWLTVPADNRGVRGSVVALLGVLANRSLALSIATTAMLFAGGFVFYGLVAVWLEEAVRMPRDFVPIILFGYGLVGVAANIASGTVSRQLGIERTIVLGLALSGAGAAGMYVFAREFWAAILGLVLFGAAWLMIMAPMQARLVRLAGARAPLALAFNSSALYVGMATGAAVSGIAYEAVGATPLPLASAAGIALALWIFMLSRRRERTLD